MKFNTVASLLFLAGVPALASPTPTSTLQERADMCGQWDSATTGSYILYNNLWGMSSGTGSQCTTLDSVSGTTLGWHTKWSWSGGQYNVKSYSNVAYQFTALALSAIKTIPSTWKWSYSGSGIVANAAYDLFTSTSATASSQNEIMIWLGALGGAGPISSTGSPVVSGVSLAGQTWNLYEGYNGAMKVFSFVRSSSDVTSFSGDLNLFLKYLTSNRGLSTSQVLTNVQAGTEPFVGSGATFTVSAYSAVVNK